MKNNHKGAQINGVHAYAHSFSMFFLLCFVRMFFTLAFLYSLFSQVTKTRYNTRVSKKISYVCYIFFALTSTDCLINIGTSNAKTHNTKLVGLFFIFILEVWIAYFG
jgi:hypothetical protein